MGEGVVAAAIRPWLRPEHAQAYEAALEWLGPRCRTEEERRLAPSLLLALAPLNALVAPCRPVEGSRVNFQVTLSREGPDGPERVRVTVRAGSGPRDTENPGLAGDMELHLWLDSTRVLTRPLSGAAEVLTDLLLLSKKRISAAGGESDTTSA